MFKKILKSFGLVLFLSSSIFGKAYSADLTFFTIGTGGTAYTYYPVGGMIANAISKPPGSRECGKGGSCGVEGLIASAVSSRGSVDNVNAILSGLRNSGFAQSDVAYWAYTGTGEDAVGGILVHRRIRPGESSEIVDDERERGRKGVDGWYEEKKRR